MKKRLLSLIMSSVMILSMSGLSPVWADDVGIDHEMTAENIAAGPEQEAAGVFEESDIPESEPDALGIGDLISQAGYEEGAFVTFAGAQTDKYTAYVSKDKEGWKKLDDELIRYYVGGTWRVDALGLTPGTWYIRVVQSGGNEKISGPLSVNAHDRSGFAWVGGTASGAYNEDGSLKDDAVVIYVTDANKNNLNASITVNGSVRNCGSLPEVFNVLKNSGAENDPVCVRLIGNIHDASGFSSTGGDLLVQNKLAATGITIEGVGNDATANGWGITFKNAANVEVRNLGFMNCDSSEGDDVSLNSGNNHIWIHNCDLFYGMPGKDADQVKGDGALDCRKSTYCTFSYNHFWDNGKSNLLANVNDHSSTEGLYVTYHHNWYDHSDSRHPRVRYYSAHVYNNYYDGNAKYGSGATLGSSIFMDSNYFRNCHYPMMISMQGTDSLYAGGNFSSEDGGMIKAYGNRFAGKYTFIPYGRAYMVKDGAKVDFDNSGTDTGEDFDAYPVKERGIKVSENVVSKMGSNHYNNFDTTVDTGVKAEDVDRAMDVPAKVMANAGRVGGGDFWYDFEDSVDDPDYAVNYELRTALTNYGSNLVQVGSEEGTQIEEHNNTAVTYVRTARDPLSNTDGKFYDEFYNGDPDEVIPVTAYVTEVFEASKFVKEVMKITDPAHDGADIATPTKYGIFTLNDCRVPSKKLDVIALDPAEGKNASFVIDAPKKGTLSISLTGSSDTGKSYVQLLYRGTAIKDKNDKDVITVAGKSEVVANYEIPYTGTYTLCYAEGKESSQVRIATCKLKMSESDEPNPQPDPDTEDDKKKDDPANPVNPEDPSEVSAHEMILIAKDKTFNVGEKLTALNAAAVEAAKAANPKVKFKYEVTEKAAKKIVTVNSKGVVKAKKAGKAVIRIKYKAKVEGKKQWIELPETYTINVQSPSFSVKKVTMVLAPEGTAPAAVDLNGILTEGSTTLPLTDFVSSKPAVATVSDKGVVTAVAKGSAKISFRIGNVTFKMSVKVRDK